MAKPDSLYDVTPKFLGELEAWLGQMFFKKLNEIKGQIGSGIFYDKPNVGNDLDIEAVTLDLKIDSDASEVFSGANTRTVAGNDTDTVEGALVRTIEGHATEIYQGGVTHTVDGAEIRTADTVEWDVTGGFALTSAAVGVFGATPVLQQATPVTLADVIALLQAYGWSA